MALRFRQAKPLDEEYPVQRYEAQEEEEPTFPTQVMQGLGGFLRNLLGGTASSYLGSESDVLSMAPHADQSERYYKEAETPIEQIQFLSDESELPYEFNLSGLPTTYKIEEFAGAEEPQDFSSKLGRRSGHVAGPLLKYATNPVAAIPALLKQAGTAGLFGQLAEEAGSGPIVQALAELVGGGIGGAKPKNINVTSKKQPIQEALDTLETLNVTEKSRTVAKHALEGNKKLAKATGSSINAQHALEEASKEVSKALETYKQKLIPNLKKGRNFLTEEMNRVMDAASESVEYIPIINTKPYTHSLEELISEAKQVPGLSTERKSVIADLNSQLKNVKKGINANGDPLTAGDLLRQYRDNNSTHGSWIDKNVKKNAMKEWQDTIIDTIASQGPEGKLGAKMVRDSNKYYQRFKRTEEVLDGLESVITSDGTINFGKLKNNLDNVDKRNLIQEVMGPNSVKDLAHIADAGIHIDKLQKALGSSQMQYYLEKGALTGIAGSILGIVSGSTSAPVALAAGVPFLTIKAQQKLAEKILTDPSYQNMTANFLQSLKNNLPKQTASWAHKIERALDEDTENEKAKKEQTSNQKLKLRLRPRAAA